TSLHPASASTFPARASAGRRASGNRSPASGSSPCSGGCWNPGSRVGLSGESVEEKARLRRVTVHLLDERRQVGEGLFVAQPGAEFDLDAASVQIAIEIEQVRFEQRFAPPHRGTRTEAGHRGQWIGTNAVHLNCEDPRQRRCLAAESQIRSGIAERPAETVAADDASTDRV